MENPDIFELLAELAAIFIGFSVLTSAFDRRQSGGVNTVLRVGQRFIIIGASCLLLISIVPLGLHALDIESPLLWRLSALILMLTSFLFVRDFIVITRNLSEHIRRRIVTGRTDRLVLLVSLFIPGGALVLFGPSDWPLEGIYTAIAILMLGNVTILYIYNSMPRRFRR